MELQIISPLNINNYTVKENRLSSIGFKPFEERTISLIKRFEKALDDKYTQSLGSPVYLARDVFGNDKPINKKFEGVYKIGAIEDYVGDIPLENQNEIIVKYNKLINNHFIPFKFKLAVLAPINHFASENNIKAIDPIVFAYFSPNEDYTGGASYYLIPLTHWI